MIGLKYLNLLMENLCRAIVGFARANAGFDETQGRVSWLTLIKLARAFFRTNFSFF